MFTIIIISSAWHTKDCNFTDEENREKNMLWRGKAVHIKRMKIRSENSESYWQNRFILDTSFSPSFHPHENLMFNCVKIQEICKVYKRVQHDLKAHSDNRAKTADLVNQRWLRHYKDICPHTAVTWWELPYCTNNYLASELVLFEVEA